MKMKRKDFIKAAVLSGRWLASAGSEVSAHGRSKHKNLLKSA